PERGPSWIVKQAGESAPGHPDFRVPSERIVFEQRYARAASALAPERASVLPGVRHFDEAQRVLVMEDAGDGQSLELRLRAGQAPRAALRDFGAFLAAVHAASARCAERLEPRFGNHGMRQLNGAQMFLAPYAAGLPSLPAELAPRREQICADRELRARVE